MQTLGHCTQPCADVSARSKTGGDIHERQLVAAPAATVETQRRVRQQHLIDPGFDQGPLIEAWINQVLLPDAALRFDRGGWGSDQLPLVDVTPGL